MNKLTQIQAELKAPKGQFNSFGKYKYRSCEDIVEAAKPVLAKYGFYLTLSDEVVMLGERFYVKATAAISDGESNFVTTAFAREEEIKKGMDGSQITGAASSYARKYALNGLFAIDDTKDADATNQHDDKPVKAAEVNADEVGDDKRMHLITMLEKTSYEDIVKDRLAERIEHITSMEAYNKALENIKLNMINDEDRVAMGLSLSSTDVNKAVKNALKKDNN